jgi:hypothetical protein
MTRNSLEERDAMAAVDEKAGVRAEVFHDLAGIVLAPTVKALADRGVLRLLAADDGVTFEEILRQTRANRGYMRVALRLLASSGWLRQDMGENESAVSYALTEEGRIASQLAPALYSEVTSFIPKALFLSDYLFSGSDPVILPSLRELVGKAEKNWGMGLPDDTSTQKVLAQIRDQLEGMLVGPAMVALARGGVFDQIGEAPIKLREISGNAAMLGCIFSLLALREWAVVEGECVRLTSRGQYAAQIASSYGVTVSYLPTLNSLSVLLFGNPRIARFDDSGVELLVDRAMNVWGSGGAHKTYFRKVDEIILDIFNRPLAAQPKGICDMGCGDGTFLEHLHSVIKNCTARGRALETHPLTLVGADYNKVARRVTKQTLQRAGISNYQVVNGDINRPAQLASDFEKLELDIHDFFHVRSFLDHNRQYLPPANYVAGSRKARTTGVFAHLGDEISAAELEENLVRHLRRWAPYTGRFGLLVLELHTLPPDVAAEHLDRTPVVAYDGTHGYSDQYLVEVPVFLDRALESGLQADARYQATFPPSELATVSINLFAAPGLASA